MYYAALYLFLMSFCCATPIVSLLGPFLLKWLTLGSQPHVGPAKIVVLLIFMLALCCSLSGFLLIMI